MQPGTRLEHYEILGKIGEGGMGEVYRANDPKLDREVAIKVLPAEVAGDAERLSRFEREARLLASLNHPNIAHVYGFEAATLPDGALSHFLVMELVEGEDLAARLERGAVPIDEALEIAGQIAAALEQAHEQGIVHRDLKPANVKVTLGGKVKVLDFGLAKAYAGESPSSSTPDLTQSPTLAYAGTQAGVILGTAAYMSPEQARGKPVDRRADLWAFGVVLYEMLTGRKLFTGETASDILALVLTREPDWDGLPTGTPPAVCRLLRRCLARDPRDRLRDAGDAALELREAEEGDAMPSHHTRRPVTIWLPWLIAVVAGAFALWAMGSRPVTDPSSVAEGHFTIELPSAAELVTSDVPMGRLGSLVLSPDGGQVVYVAPNGRGTQLFVRTMTDLTPRPLAGTEGAQMPFFSPDGLSVAFFADGKLKKTLLSGGTPATLADAPSPAGGSWGANGEIVFAPSEVEGLFVISATGGESRRLTALDSAAGDDGHVLPQMIDDGRSVIFTVIAYSRETTEIELVDRATGERRLIQEEAAFARYVPAPDGTAGHLVFVRGEALVAAPFDPLGGGRAGSPIAVLDGVRAGQFDFSASGVLAYVPSSGTAPDYSLVWVDRAGVVTPINDLPRGYEDLHLSPDGRHVALTVEESGPDSPAHVWLADTDRGTLSRLTFEGFSRDPVWSPDGETIVFGSKRDEDTFGLYVQRADGSAPAELAWASPIPIWPDPQSWTPDGRTIVFTTKGADTRDDIWTLSLDDGSAEPWLATPGQEWGGRLSPDGRWMAYNAIESGHRQVYVQPYPGPGAKRLVSEDGGTNPIWSTDGRELFYRRGDEVVAVDIDASGGFTMGKPVVLFSGPYRLSGRDYAVSPDGSRFVMMRANEPRTTGTIRVVLDWWRTLAGRLQGSR